MAIPIGAIAQMAESSFGMINSGIGLIKGGQERRAQESAQRHELVQMALANRMQQQQLQMQSQNVQQNSQNPSSNNKNLFVFGGIGIIIIALIVIIVWKHSKK